MLLLFFLAIILVDTLEIIFCSEGPDGKPPESLSEKPKLRQELMSDPGTQSITSGFWWGVLCSGLSVTHKPNPVADVAVMTSGCGGVAVMWLLSVVSMMRNR